MKPPAAGKHPPEKYVYRRSCLRDALDCQGLIVNAAKDADIGPLALSSLVQAFCRLVPIVMALRGRPLMLHGSVTKRIDMTPKEAARQLKALKPLHIIEAMTETPAEQPEKNVKGIS